MMLVFYSLLLEDPRTALLNALKVAETEAVSLGFEKARDNLSKVLASIMASLAISGQKNTQLYKDVLQTKASLNIVAEGGFAAFLTERQGYFSPEKDITKKDEPKSHDFYKTGSKALQKEAEEFVRKYGDYVLLVGKNPKTWYGYSSSDPSPLWYSTVEKDFTLLKGKYGSDAEAFKKDLSSAVEKLYGDNKYKQALLDEFSDPLKVTDGLIRLALTQQAIDGLSICLKAKQLGRVTSYAEIKPFFEYFLTLHDPAFALTESDIRVLAGEKSGPIDPIVSKLFSFLESGNHSGLVSIVIDSNFGEDAMLLDNLLKYQDKSYVTAKKTSVEKLSDLYSACWSGMGSGYRKTWEGLYGRYKNSFSNMLSSGETLSNGAISQISSFKVDTYSFVDFLNILYARSHGGEYLEQLSVFKVEDRVYAEDFFGKMHVDALTFGVIMQNSKKFNDVYYGLGQESKAKSEQFLQFADRVAQHTHSLLTEAVFEKGKSRITAATDFIKDINTNSSSGLGNLNNFWLVRENRNGVNRVVAIKDPTGAFYVVTREGVQEVWDASQLKNMSYLSSDSDELTGVDEWSNQVLSYLGRKYRITSPTYISPTNQNLSFQLDFMSLMAQVDKAYANAIERVEPFKLVGGDASLSYKLEKIELNKLLLLSTGSLVGSTNGSIRWDAEGNITTTYDEKGEEIAKDGTERYSLMVDNFNTVLGNFTNQAQNLVTNYIESGGVFNQVTITEEKDEEGNVISTTVNKVDRSNKDIDRNIVLNNKTGKVFTFVYSDANTSTGSDLSKTTKTDIDPVTGEETVAYDLDTKNLLDSKNLRLGVLMEIDGSYYMADFEEAGKNDRRFSDELTELLKTNSKELDYVFNQMKYAEAFQKIGRNFTGQMGVFTLTGRDQTSTETTITEENNPPVTEQTLTDKSNLLGSGFGIFFGAEYDFRKLNISTLNVPTTTGKNFLVSIEADFDKKGKDPKKSLIFGVADLRYQEKDIYGQNVDQQRYGYGYSLGQGTKIGLISYKIMDQLSLMGAFGANKDALVSGLRLDMPNLSSGLVVRFDKDPVSQEYKTTMGSITSKYTSKKFDLVGYGDFGDKLKPNYGFTGIVKFSEKERLEFHASVPQFFSNLDEQSVKGIRESIKSLEGEITAMNQDVQSWDNLSSQEQQNLVKRWADLETSIRKSILRIAPGQDLGPIATDVSVEYYKGSTAFGISYVRQENGEYVMATTSFDVNKNLSTTLVVGDEITGNPEFRGFGGITLSFKKGLFEKPTSLSTTISNTSQDFSLVQSLGKGFLTTLSLKNINNLYTGGKLELGKEKDWKVGLQYGEGTKGLKLYGIDLSKKNILGENSIVNIGYTNTSFNDMITQHITGSVVFTPFKNAGFEANASFLLPNLTGRKNDVKLENVNLTFRYYPWKK